ncbi:hypothetical protein KEHDKFFH_08445 [Marinobacter maroccanus]|uniref:PA14 domain-containing protein n=1 Tax=Marinobacter maroccanus TaxID=2055143 RepID=A0A2S5ZBY6_9GAMM|nr:PA14 domain-containing protein [Marinobacter maroccanus]PPI84722.1 hypothetical protein KEHDKFFH_08445 [Marinobacter maroccanus]
MNASSIVTVAILIFFLTGCQSWQQRPLEDLPPTASLPDRSEPGKAQIWFWDNISGAKVADFTSLESYPDNPTEVGELDSLQLRGNRADSYGAMVQGFIVPEETGEYRFFVSGDDETQFLLSTDANPENARLVASVPSWSYPENYTQFSAQTSGIIVLESGVRYYFQLLFKEGSYDDHFSVAWEGPGLDRRVVSGQYLHSWGAPLYPLDDASKAAYSMGYRVGYVDGNENLSFNPQYPPTDEDQDGLYDNWEVVMGLDPRDSGDANSDPDNDFLTAADEFALGTRENMADTDGDGIPDGVEFAYKLDPLDSSDANQDLDGDGASNLDEYLGNTALDDPDDFPEVAPAHLKGFAGQYFSGMEFVQFYTTRPGENIQFNWAREAPMEGLPVDRFSVRWIGQFEAPHSSGTRSYRFSVRTDDGARLYLDSELVIDRWVNRAATTNSDERALEAEQVIPIVVEYYENAYDAIAEFTIVDLNSGDVIDTMEHVSAPDPQSSHTQDTDADGIPDAWELRFGANMYQEDSSAVLNNSGVTSLDAYQSGLNPWTLEQVAEPPSSPEDASPPPPTSTSGSVTVTWTAPSTRTDGSSISLSEIDYYELSYGQSVDRLTETVTVGPAETSYTFDGLSTGDWFFAIRVIDTQGLASDQSEPVSFSIQ